MNSILMPQINFDYKAKNFNDIYFNYINKRSNLQEKANETHRERAYIPKASFNRFNKFACAYTVLKINGVYCRVNDFMHYARWYRNIGELRNMVVTADEHGVGRTAYIATQAMAVSNYIWHQQKPISVGVLNSQRIIERSIAGGKEIITARMFRDDVLFLDDFEVLCDYTYVDLLKYVVRSLIKRRFECGLATVISMLGWEAFFEHGIFNEMWYLKKFDHLHMSNQKNNFLNKRFWEI